MNKELVLKSPIEWVAKNAKEELLNALDSFYTEHGEKLQPRKRFSLPSLPIGKQKKEKRKGVLDRATFNLEFVNYLVKKCPSVTEVQERKNTVVSLVRPNVYSYSFFVIKSDGLHLCSWDLHDVLLSPNTLQIKFDEEREEYGPDMKKYIKEFANLDGKQIVDKIIKGLKIK